MESIALNNMQVQVAVGGLYASSNYSCLTPVGYPRVGLIFLTSKPPLKWVMAHIQGFVQVHKKTTRQRKYPNIIDPIGFCFIASSIGNLKAGQIRDM